MRNQDYSQDSIHLITDHHLLQPNLAFITVIFVFTKSKTATILLSLVDLF